VRGESNTSDGLGVRGEGPDGVFGKSSTAGGRGVVGEGKIGVFGKSSDTPEGRGVVGEGGTGVFGASNLPGGAAVIGRHDGQTSPHGHGVRGEGDVGVLGISSRANFAAVAGDHTGAGFGVSGTAVAGTTAAVLGRHQGPDGTGVRGEGSTGVHGEGSPGVLGICSTALNPGSTPLEHHGLVAGVSGKITGIGNGPGVFGEGRYGGEFKGGSAQLRLVPATTVGRPTTGFHSKGEIFMDSEATLFVCVANGTPGSWRRVMTEPPA
jgi:hypothetical protein